MGGEVFFLGQGKAKNIQDGAAEVRFVTTGTTGGSVKFLPAV